MVLEDFKNEDGKWIKLVCVNRAPVYTRAGQVWRAMRDRCNPTGSKQQKYSRYVGCLMSSNFKDFNYFAEWCQCQIGYALPDYDLDKDILVTGNKLYSEETCVFVPQTLNTFFISCNASRGDLPRGVYSKNGKFAAMISINGKRKTLGSSYATPEIAYNAYKVAKELEANIWHSRLSNKEFIIDPRVIERLHNWKLIEED